MKPLTLQEKMKTLKEFKNDVAIKYGYTSWNNLFKAVMGKPASLLSDMDEYADEAATLFAEQDKWVSVEERLPSHQGFVVVRKHNGLVVGVYFSTEGKFEFGDLDQTPQVTHWQPLPAAPNSSKN